MIFFNKIDKPTDKVELSLNHLQEEIDHRYERLSSVYAYLENLKEKQKDLLQEKQKRNNKKLDKELEVINNDINYLTKKLRDIKPEENLKEMRLKYKSLRARFEAIKKDSKSK